MKEIDISTTKRNIRNVIQTYNLNLENSTKSNLIGESILDNEVVPNLESMVALCNLTNTKMLDIIAFQDNSS